MESTSSLLKTDTTDWLLRATYYSCEECLDSGLIVRNHQVATCDCDYEQTADTAVDQLQSVVFERVAASKFINLHVFLCARALVKSSVTKPVPLKLLETHLQMSDRAIKGFIESLRREWLLPIGSRKESPSGYYWIRTAEEMKDWLTAFISQPKSELHTAYKMVNANFPELAGQLNFDFTEGEN